MPPASSPGPAPGPSAELLEGLAPLARCADAYQAELGASAVLGGAYARAESPDIRGEVVTAFAAELVRLVGDSSAPQALVALAGLGAVAPGEAAKSARQALQRNVAGAPAPPWIGNPGRVECTGAWMLKDPYGDAIQYLVSFGYEAGVIAGGPEHVVVARVDQNLRVILEAALISPGRPIVEQARQAGEGEHVTFTEIPPAVVRADVAEALAYTDELPHPPGGQEYIEQWALVRARLMSLPGDAPGSRPLPLSEEGRNEVVQRFAASPEGVIGADAGELPRNLVTECARLAVEFAVELGNGDPLRWSPASVRMVLLGWMPRLSDLSREVVAAFPYVLDAFVTYAGQEKRLPEAAIAITRQMIALCADDYLARITAGLSGPPPQDTGESAEEVMALMQVDGVDPSDEAAAQQWLTDYYSRQAEQRDS